MKLRQLMTGIEPLQIAADLDMEIRAVAYDSRKVTEGALFVAISGFASDGNRFIPMAMEKGAAVVVTAKKPDLDIPYILVPSDRLALAMIAVNWFGAPAQSMTMIGITGGYRVHHAVAHMILQDDLAGIVQGGPDGSQLHQDFGAIAALFHHPLYLLQVADGTGQAVDHGFLIFVDMAMAGAVAVHGSVAVMQ